jgi:hypothetical protein
VTQLYLSKGALPLDYFRPSIDYILDVQRSDGAIPWFHGGHFDPWDHTEAAMGLSIAGHLEEAEQAYDWLRQWQLEDGSWWARYEQGQPVLDAEARKESNFTAYVATGVWHHYLITTDESFLRRMWRTVERAIDHVVALQCRRGTIPWAIDAEGVPRAQALVTGCSSIHKSLECAINIAHGAGPASAALGRGALAPRRGAAPPPRALRPHLGEQGALLDGLVLPGARRACWAVRLQAKARLRRALG